MKVINSSKNSRSLASHSSPICEKFQKGEHNYGNLDKLFCCPKGSDCTEITKEVPTNCSLENYVSMCRDFSKQPICQDNNKDKEACNGNTIFCLSSKTDGNDGGITGLKGALIWSVSRTENGRACSSNGNDYHLCDKEGAVTSNNVDCADLFSNGTCTWNDGNSSIQWQPLEETCGTTTNVDTDSLSSSAIIGIVIGSLALTGFLAFLTMKWKRFVYKKRIAKRLAYNE